jgi:hypothetical protein
VLIGVVLANLNPRIYGSDIGWRNTAYSQALVKSEARGALTGVAWSGMPRARCWSCRELGSQPQQPHGQLRMSPQGSGPRLNVNPVET